MTFKILYLRLVKLYTLIMRIFFNLYLTFEMNTCNLKFFFAIYLKPLIWHLTIPILTFVILIFLLLHLFDTDTCHAVIWHFSLDTWHFSCWIQYLKIEHWQWHFSITLLYFITNKLQNCDCNISGIHFSHHNSSNCNPLYHAKSILCMNVCANGQGIGTKRNHFVIN